MKIFNKNIGIFELLLFLVLVVIFYFGTFVINTDIQLHAQFIKDYAYGNKAFPVNFLYYLTVYTASFFASKTSALLVVSVYILAIATFAKYYIVKSIFYKEVLLNTINGERTASILATLLLFSFSLPSLMVKNDFYYLLSSPPNVWHNSTTIFAMPFVVLLFWLSWKQLQIFSGQRMVWIGILIVLNVLIKPSFLFVYLIIYPILLLKKFKFSKLFWINIIPLIIASLLIITEYYLIYLGNESTDKNSVEINFFFFIKTWAAGENVLLVLFLAILSSLLFPIVVLLKNRSLLKSDMVQFAVACCVLSLIIANTFSESGTRVNDGNFLWQSIMSSFLLFFVCIFQVAKLASSKGWKSVYLEVSVLGLHVAAGILYFSKIILTDSYF